MRLKFQKRSALKFVSRTITRAKLRGTSLQVELSREAEDNATSRKLHRIHSPAGAEGFQVAGLKISYGFT